MAKFSLRQLRIFVEVADKENLTAASRSLSLSPATMSEALKDLEGSLGQPLFDRANRRLRLNTAGRSFNRDASKLLSQSDALYCHYVGHTRLSCGASVTVGNYILPPLLNAMMRDHPELNVDLVIRNSESVVKLVVEKKIQAAVVEGRVGSSHLECVPWREDELAIIASPDHLLAKGATQKQLASARWILRETGSGTRESFDEAAQSWLVTPHVVLAAGGNEIIKRAVADGLGLGCLSLAAVSSELARGDLVRVPSPTPMVRTLTFLRRHDAVEDQSLAIFVAALGL